MIGSLNKAPRKLIVIRAARVSRKLTDITDFSPLFMEMIVKIKVRSQFKFSSIFQSMRCQEHMSRVTQVILFYQDKPAKSGTRVQESKIQSGITDRQRTNSWEWNSGRVSATASCCLFSSFFVLFSRLLLTTYRTGNSTNKYYNTLFINNLILIEMLCIGTSTIRLDITREEKRSEEKGALKCILYMG